MGNYSFSILMSRKINGLQGLIMCIYINVTKSLATKALIILTFKYPVLSLSKLLDIKIIVFTEVKYPDKLK